MTPTTPTNRRWRLGAVAIVGALALAGCGGASSKAPASPAAGASQVLPVTENPIRNTSTAQTLRIDSVLVENNVDPRTGKSAPDHLEIALQNSGPAPAGNVEVYYILTDPKKKISESYYAKLGDSFTIPAGGKRVVHFDDTTGPDHYPVNKFSLYYTSKAALDVSVTVSATDAAVQTVMVKKDPGGAENPGE